eukprot:m.11154 g.11154  ORF g.11154 m.11154 type:complete len:142 (-) comp5676_c0_seq2:48-473(-)
MANEVVADVFCTLLEVSIHTILYMRQVYPVHIFAKSRVYNITTLTSRHPELTDYIANVVASIREWIIKGKVKAVVVVLFNEVQSILPSDHTPRHVTPYISQWPQFQQFKSHQVTRECLKLLPRCTMCLYNLLLHLDENVHI